MTMNKSRSSPLFFAGILLLLMLFGLIYQLWQARQETIDMAKRASRSMAELLVTRVESDFARLDGVLGFAAGEFLPAKLAAMSTAERTAQSARLERLIIDFPAVAEAFVFDAEGQLVIASIPHQPPFNIVDRPHFKALRDDPRLTTVFSDPLLTRSTGKMAVVQSRAIRDTAGRFLGIVNAIYHLETLSEQIARIEVGPSGTALLRRTDNFKLIVHHPPRKQSVVGESIPENNPIRLRIDAGQREASLQYMASTDGEQRVGSFRVLDQYPFFVLVAFSESEVLANLNRQAQLLVGMFFLLGVPMLLILLRLERTRANEQAATDKLLAQQLRLEKISQNIPGAIYQFQRWPDGRSAIPYASQGIRTIYGIAPEYLDEDAAPVFAAMHPDDLAQVVRSIEESANALTPWHDIHRVFLPDGNMIWAEGDATPERMPDGSVLWHGYIRDVTARKVVEQRIEESETSFRLLFDDAPDAYLIMSDQEGRILACNRAAERMLRGRWEQIVDADPATLSPPRQPDGRPTQEFVAENIATILRVGHHRFEHLHRRLDGEEFWVEVSAAVGSYRGQQALYVAWREIGEVIAAKQAAQAATVAKSRFLATMSHEIRTPMNGILGMAQMLLMPNVSEAERCEYARTILNSGQTLLKLLNDILDYSKVEAGKLELDPVVFEPTQLMREVQSLFAETARTKGLQFEAIWRGGEASYLADVHRLRQMLANLVSNAIKFTAYGRVGIEVAETERKGDIALLEFAVRDTGVGIAEDSQEQLFKPFSQADSSITRQFGGTGLGLSIVRNLASLMGGDVGVDSELGMGSCFWFRIRAEVIEGADTRRVPRIVSPRQPREQPLAATHLSMGAKLLVVEDDATNQKVICAMLATLGMTSVIADDGQQAIDRISRGEMFDLILMDIQMPVMDGIEATAQIRQHEREHGEARRPIIALTADAFAEHRERCHNVGMDDFLTKPIDIAELSRLLRYWLASPAVSVGDRPNGGRVAEAVDTVPPAPTFDESALLKPLGGNRELARLIIVSATGDFPHYLKQLGQACQAADWKTAERLAHTMKGLAAQIGGLDLTRRMREAEEWLKRGETLDADALAQLQAEYAALVTALQPWRETDGEKNDEQ